MRDVLALFLLALMLATAHPAYSEQTASCARFFEAGMLLEWSVSNGVQQVAKGNLRIDMVFKGTFEGTQFPAASGGTFAMNGSFLDDRVKMTVPRWAETWEGECTEDGISGKVRHNTFTMRPAPKNAAPMDTPQEPGLSASTAAEREASRPETYASPPGTLQWAPLLGGRVPDNALATGQERGRTLYTCRTFKHGVVSAGKIGQGFNGCNTGQHGVETFAGAYDVLCGNAASVGWIPTDTAGYMVVGNKFEAGHNMGNPLYICRGTLFGGLHPGQIQEGFAGCTIGYAGKEYVIERFEIMTIR